MKTIIIGAGASGLVAGIYASKKDDVTILERNSSPGKKILLTGNGKCNYWNQNIDYKHYETEAPETLKQIINEENKKEILDFFDNLGIIPKIKNDYYYPYSNKASSINEALMIEAKLNSVNIINNFEVENIIKKDDYFIINPGKEALKADKVIICSGSKAYPKTGSDGIGYKILESFNHHIIKPLPALVPLIAQNNPLKNASGVRCDVVLNLYEDNQKIKEEQGQLQITENGISGICAFNLSGSINKGLSKNKEEKIYINFIPFLNCKSIEEVLDFINKRINKVTGRTTEQFLEGFLDYNLVKALLFYSKIEPLKYPDELNKKEKYALANTLYNFPLTITKTEDFDHGQVCIGGLSLDEINPKTLESKKIKNLYIAGELLDATGPCGGYNLGFAFISGMVAGKGSQND